MIRSLIATGGLSPEDSSVKVRRNLSMDALAESYRNGEMLWMDMTAPSDDELKWLESLIHLHPEVIKDLRRKDRRPSLLVFPDYLFVTLFEPQIKVQQLEAQEIHCLIGDNFFITVRPDTKTEVDEAYKRVSQQNPEAWRRGVSYLLYLTVQYVIDRYYPMLDRINMQLNQLEERILTKGADYYTRQENYRLKQQLITLRQMVAPQREVLSSAIGEERLSQTSDDRDLFRHLYERLLRVYDVIDSQRDLSANLLDLMQSYESARLTDAVSRLTIISMIFLPLTLLAALFELNFITTESAMTIPITGEIAFGGLVVIMISTAGGLAWLFHRKGWL